MSGPKYCGKCKMKTKTIIIQSLKPKNVLHLSVILQKIHVQQAIFYKLEISVVLVQEEVKYHLLKSVQDGAQIGLTVVCLNILPLQNSAKFIKNVIQTLPNMKILYFVGKLIQVYDIHIQDIITTQVYSALSLEQLLKALHQQQSNFAIGNLCNTKLYK